MNTYGYTIAEPIIPKISKTKFLSMSAEKQKEYIRLYKTQVAPKLEVFREHHAYKLASGGRGGAKSWSVASLLIQKLSAEKRLLLCCREVQNSIADSSKKILEETIARLEIGNWEIKKETLENTETGSMVIFRGLFNMRATNSMKSLEGITDCWIEEAQCVSAESLAILLPTIRKDGAEVWATWNSITEDDPIEKLKTRLDAIHVNINFYDNPFVTQRLLDEMHADYLYNEDEFTHTWLGQYRKQGENCILSRSGVLEAMSRIASQEGDYSVGVDCARFGADSSVFTMRKGMQVIKQECHKKTSMVQLADLYERFVDFKKDICTKFDGGGVGGGFGDILQARGYRNIVEVNFGEKAQDTDKYDSAVSEMWFTFNLAEAGLPNDTDLLAELSDRRYTYNHKTQKVVEKKEDYKKRHSGKSPDKADSLLLCFYEKHIIRPMLY